MNFFTSVSQFKNDILIRGYKDGKRVEYRERYHPYLFVPTKKNTKYRTLQNEPVGKVRFDSIFDARDFITQYKDVSNFNVYGLTQFVYTFIYDNYPGEILYDPLMIRVAIIDIETAMKGGFPKIREGDQEVTSITFRMNGKSTIFGCKSYVIPSSDIEYVHCRDEKELLTKFLEHWIRADIDVVTGWNVEFFDVPYLVNRIRRILGADYAKKLSPWEILNERIVEIHGNENQTFDLVGISILDYLPVYKKFIFKNRDSFSLDNIAFIELEERKLDYSEYKNLDELYEKDYIKYINYNNRDCVLVERLDKKLNFIRQIFSLAYDAKVNYNDTLATVRPWEIICHNYLLDQNVVFPPEDRNRDDFGIQGAFVKEPNPGFAYWVVSFDVKSLYPSLFMMLNVSPETFLGKLDTIMSVDEMLEMGIDRIRDKIDGDYCIAANLALYRRDIRGFIPKLIEQKFAQRVFADDKCTQAKRELELVDAEIARRKYK